MILFEIIMIEMIIGFGYNMTVIPTVYCTVNIARNTIFIKALFKKIYNYIYLRHKYYTIKSCLKIKFNNAKFSS